MRPFRNDRVRWVRKVKFPPLKFLEIGTGGLIILVTLHTAYGVLFVTDLPIFDKLGIFGFYVKLPIWIFAIIASAQAVISYFPRKLYVMENLLVIKSLSYFSLRIKTSDISSIKAVSLFKVITSPRMWLPLWNSFHYYDLKFWRPGMLIELNSGKMYFFSTKDSHACVKELSGLLVEEKEVVFDEKEAA